MPVIYVKSYFFLLLKPDKKLLQDRTQTPDDMADASVVLP